MNALICVDYADKIKSRHALACYSLEIGKSWNDVIKKWFEDF
jgi:hypothetical protein